MKSISYFIFTLLLVISCSHSKNNEKNNSNIEVLQPEENKLTINFNDHSNLNEWVTFYQKIDSSFSLDNFEFKSTDSLTLMQGTIYGTFDPEFDAIYNDFLVYNNDRSKYIDFDSYNWELDQNKKPIFSADQEIDIVDVRNKTAQRIAFRGPTEWVENAFWQNETTVILLENNYEKRPIITQIHLKEKLVKTFQYKDNLSFDSYYFKHRFKNKGLLIE